MFEDMEWKNINEHSRAYWMFMSWIINFIMGLLGAPNMFLGMAGFFTVITFMGFVVDLWLNLMEWRREQNGKV